MFFAPALRTRAYVPARAFDRNFERFLNEAFAPAAAGVKVEQSDEAWTVSLDVPGWRREGGRPWGMDDGLTLPLRRGRQER